MPVSWTVYLSQGARGISMGPYMVWVGLMMALVIVATGILMAYRRRVLSNDDESANSSRLLVELRAMRNRGEISIEEFDIARASVVTQLSGAEHPKKQPVSAKQVPKQDTKVAEPGFDLTGEPLPGNTDSPPGGNN